MHVFACSVPNLLLVMVDSVPLTVMGMVLVTMNLIVNWTFVEE